MGYTFPVVLANVTDCCTQSGPVYVATCVLSLAAAEGPERGCSVPSSSEKTEQVTFMLLIYVRLCNLLVYGVKS